MKYVTFTLSQHGHDELIAVLFSDAMIHANVAYGMQHAARGSLAGIGGAIMVNGKVEPHGAGFFRVNTDGTITTSGRSESMNLGPAPDDAELIAKALKGGV